MSLEAIREALQSRLAALTPEIGTAWRNRAFAPTPGEPWQSVDMLPLDPDDAEIGAAARVVHGGCRKLLAEHFTLAPVRAEAEGSRVTLAAGFDAAAVRLTGNVVGQAPFTGTLSHRGWQVTQVRLPQLTDARAAAIIAQAEVEL